MDGGERLLLWLLAGVAAVSRVVAVGLLVRVVRSWRLLKASGIWMSDKTMLWASVALRVPIHHPVWSSSVVVLVEVPPSRSRRRTSKCLMCPGTLIGSGSGRSGAACSNVRCGRCSL